MLCQSIEQRSVGSSVTVNKAESPHTIKKASRANKGIRRFAIRSYPLLSDKGNSQSVERNSAYQHAKTAEMYVTLKVPLSILSPQ